MKSRYWRLVRPVIIVTCMTVHSTRLCLGFVCFVFVSSF
jgi:hypothetical protein